MTDLRTDLRDRFRDILNEEDLRAPEQSLVSVPIGKLADAAAEMVDALPALPVFRPEETQPKFFSAHTRGELADGSRFSSVSVDVAEGAVAVRSEHDGVPIAAVPLRPEMAEVFALQVLAAARHVRAMRDGMDAPQS